ncbi:MAG: hypothetical protein ORN20_06115, partial [Candidatus Nanopelagicales bacterium]|nr:hypothetical protein [Candidatus Nanopelagicales bacterium]
ASPSPSPKPTSDNPAADLAVALAQAQAAYEAGQAALAKGDFATYGEAQKRLKAALDAAAVAESKLNPDLVPTPAPSATAAPSPSASASPSTKTA